MEVSIFDHVPVAPDDPILGLSQRFVKDTRPQKVNLGVGAYKDENGKSVVLRCVRKAEKRIIERQLTKDYLPIRGFDAFREAVPRLVFGDDCSAIKEERICVVQSLSGTGALRIGSEFISRHLQYVREKNLFYVSNPTWGNHARIFEEAGFKTLQKYRYYDRVKGGFDFEGMMEDLKQAEEGSVILLHACAHNPSGADPTPEQWIQICDVCKEKKLIPFFDSAYLGFASGELEKDRFAMRLFADSGLELLVSKSFAKNLGLYGERIGALLVVCANKEAANRVLSQVTNVIVRGMYSSPQLHGARIVAEVLNDPELYAEWCEELVEMSSRLKITREKFQNKMLKSGAKGRWDRIVSEIGLFSFTDITPEMANRLEAEFGIYMTRNGRISIAGLNDGNMDYVVECFKKTIEDA